jgi:antitoxin component YwqK of YwqJK toxin-antitoxin module
MRYLIFTFSILISLASFGQDVNKTDASGKKQGDWKKIHENGTLRYKGQFKDDKPVGTFIYSDNAGNLTFVMEYDGDIARTEAYFENKKLKAKGNYKNQKKDSIWNYFSEAGFRLSEELYVNGRKEGEWKVFYKNGNVAEVKNYANDFENGEWIQYHENGKERLKATYENGSLEGKIYFYDAAGKKTMEGNHKHDVRHGAWMMFDSNGKVISKEVYINGQREGGNDDKMLPEDEERIQQDFLEFEDVMPQR